MVRRALAHVLSLVWPLGVTNSDNARCAEADSGARRDCATGARTLGRVAIGLLLVSATISYAGSDANGGTLLVIRLAGAAAAACVVWQLGRSQRHAYQWALGLVLTIAAAIETLALYTGGAASVQHDRLTPLVLGTAVLVPWSAHWMALASAGVILMFLLTPLASGGLSVSLLHEMSYLAAGSAVAIAMAAAQERRRQREVGAHAALEVATRSQTEQEARYRSVVETAASAIVVLAPDHRILEFNAEAERVYDRRREDVLGRSYLDLFVPEHAWDIAATVVRRVLAGQPTKLNEGVIKRPSGEHRTILWKNACLRDADQRPVALLAVGQDITERKRAQRALVQSEARLRRLVETSKAIPWEADAVTWRFTYVGPQAASLGYPIEEWSAPDFWTTHIHPDDRTRAMETCQGEARRSLEYDFEYRMLAADGRVVWLHDLASVERHADGSPRILRGFMIDVTERRRAEAEVQRLNAELEARVLQRTAELRDSEARLRSILDASPVGVAVIGDDGRVVEANPALRVLLGRASAACEGIPFVDLLCLDDAAPTRRALERLRGLDVDACTVEGRFVRLDGAVVWTHTALEATGTKDGPRRVFAMIQDVTARKREEALADGELQALRRLAEGRGLSEALGALIEPLERNAPDMICSVLIVDEDGRRLRHAAAPGLDDAYTAAVDGRAIGPVAGSCGTAAYRRERVVVEDIERDPLWGEFRELAMARGLRACWSEPVVSATGELLGTFALYHRTARGPTDGELALIEAAARTAAIVIERQRLDDLVRTHRSELAHVGRVSLLAELAGGLAHQVQQPLAAIVNYAGACDNFLRNGAIDVGSLRDAVGRIRDTAHQAGQIIRGIRSFAQKREPQGEHVDVNELVRSAIRLVEGEARQHGIAIRLDLKARLRPVHADRIQIEQVLLNVLMNGIEAMAPDRRGELVVRSWARDDGAIAITAQDNGPPIPPDVASRMFEPFFTTKSLGLGMGLPIARTIVEAHGGTLWAEPGGDGGVTVGFALPASLAVARRRRAVGPRDTTGVPPPGADHSTDRRAVPRARRSVR